MIDLTPHARTAHWSAAYVGRAWSPEFTCWTLVQAVQREQFGRTMPDLKISEMAPTPANEQALRALMGGTAWSCVARGPHALGFAGEGDIVLMRGPNGHHVGIATRQGLLHNSWLLKGGKPQGGVCLDPFHALGGLHYGHFELWGASA